MSFKHRNTCRICGNSELDKILSLGMHPPSNNFITDKQIKSEKSYPLDVYFCKNCSLVQLLDVVNPKLLFNEYSYLTGTSVMLVEHLKTLANKSLEYIPIDTDVKGLIVDIGCNDGTLLRNYDRSKFNVIGIDPANNISKIVEDVQIMNRFFNRKCAIDIVNKHGKADVVLATNVFAHIDDLEEVCFGIRNLLKDKGVFIIEVHYIVDLLNNNEFDTIYHEHLCYFSLNALHRLFKKHRMVVVDAERIHNHGGSIRVFIKKHGEESESVKRLLAEEREFGIFNLSTYNSFESRVKQLKCELRKTLLDLKHQGYKITAYGATAKGNTLLNYCKIGNDILDYISDRTSFKIGKISPGMHIPIVSEDDYHKDKVDYVLLLAWNYMSDILEKEKCQKFIIPIPKVEICQK